MVGGPGANSQQIIKQNLSFEAKVWWTVIRYRLCPTTRENILSSIREALIEGLMVGYKFDMGQFISKEIQDRALGRERLVLVFPCLITQICLE